MDNYWKFIIFFAVLCFGAWQNAGAESTDVTINADANVVEISNKSGASDTAIISDFKVGVVGDVMAAGLEVAIKRQAGKFGALKVQTFNYARGSSGFVRDDYYDWNAEIPDILSREKLDYLLVMIGSNDRQSIRGNGKRYKKHTPLWREEYIHRVDAFINKVRKENVKIIWMGQAIARGKSFSNDMATFNEIFRQRVENHGETFFDVWNLFTNGNGKYSAYGADNLGQVKKLRASNGIHFTKRGYDKMAFQVLTYIQNVTNPEFGFVKNEDLGEVVTVEKYEVTDDEQKDSVLVAKVKAPEQVLKVEDVKPKNVFELNEEAQTPTVITNVIMPKAEPFENLPLWEKVLEKGYVIEPKFGRGDDFSWPRN